MAEANELDELAATMHSAPATASQGSARSPGASDGRLGRYVLIEELGRGAMGRVHRAYDPRLHREVALKVLIDGVGTEAQMRVIREARALAQLNHPNVVAVYDVDTFEGIRFIAMELVTGGTLGAA